LGKTSENLGKIPESLDKKSAQLQKMAPAVCRKAQLRPFSWRSHQEQVFMFFVGENLWEKGAHTLFGQVWGNSIKNPSHPQKFPCSYTYVLSNTNLHH